MRRTITIGRRLAACRLAAGLSQAQVAERVGMTRTWLSRVEGGQRTTSYQMIERLCRALGTSVATVSTLRVL